MTKLDISRLAAAVAGGSPAIRSITRLEPAGGRSDKVFPPTYLKEGRADTKYALEERRIDGREVQTVLLDSVASQANRIEQALLEEWHRRELPFPVIGVDFGPAEGLEDVGLITALDAPHRIADAIFRDSLLDGLPFRMSEPGRAYSDATPRAATAVYRYCPTALVLGVWDSTGPKGGLGAKFQRCLVSEIIGVDVKTGVKTASRLDPLKIEKNAAGDAGIFEHKDAAHGWTLDAAEARQEKKKPVPFKRGDKKDTGTPAALNHGNIPPSIDREAGGVTMDHAVQTVVLSLAGLRRLGFHQDSEGNEFTNERRLAAENAGRTALAALALAGVVFARTQGYDLRSRSLLVATEKPRFEILSPVGEEPEVFELDADAAADLLVRAEAQAREFALGWERTPFTLQPADKLVQLVRGSRDLQAAPGEGGDD